MKETKNEKPHSVGIGTKNHIVERALQWLLKRKNVLLLCYILSLVLLAFSSFSVSGTLRSLGFTQVELDHSRASSTEISSNNIQDKIHLIEGDVQETSSACLLVCDDNHFLIEWIAYHYFAVDLRYLIITRDPRCRTSPDHVLDRWRDKLTIEYWNDSHFLEIDGDKTILETHRARQSQFYIGCLRTLKRKNRSWVLLTDTDEFVTINPGKSDGINPFSKSEEKNKSLLFPKMERLPSISEPGSVMTFLKNVIVPDKSIGLVGPCLPIYRKQFSARESSKLEVEQGLSDLSSGKASFDYMAFLTLRWRKWRLAPEGVFKTVLGKKCWTKKHIIPGKVVIDLSRIREQDLYHTDIKGDPHRPVESVCPQGIQSTKKKDAGLILHHYLGSPEQFFYRSTDSRGEGYRMGHYRQIHNKLGSSENDRLRPWLEGFVGLVGEDEAFRLLKGVGELEPTLDGSGQQLNWNLTLTDSESGDKTHKIGDLVQGKYKDEWYWAQVTDVIAGMYYNLVLIAYEENCFEIVGAESNIIRLRGYTIDSLSKRKIMKRKGKRKIKEIKELKKKKYNELVKSYTDILLSQSK